MHYLIAGLAFTAGVLVTIAIDNPHGRAWCAAKARKAWAWIVRKVGRDDGRG